jgi:glucokinase
MRLLALDIGGTNSRFADCHYQSKTNFNIDQIFNLQTNQSGIHNFQDLLNAYEASKPESFLNLEDYDLISIAVAGPVAQPDGRQCSPPNIPWDIDLDDYSSLPKTVLLNDFTAQAYAFQNPEEIIKLDQIRISKNSVIGNTAIIGAGTGLGHCLLVPIEESYYVVPSEAGQSTFTFNIDEKELESFILNKTRKTLAINDHIVSGSGLSLIHEFFTKQSLSPETIFSDHDQNHTTLEVFSRFYARACRNYCLSSCVTDKLIISGGLAAKHPEIINSEDFSKEFELSESHRHSLENISIYMNNNENIGLIGSCFYALSV